MIAARLHGKHDIRVDTVEAPADLRPGEIRVRPQWCGICGSDLHEYETGGLFVPAENKPQILGHEFSAEVIEVAEDVRSVRVGDRAAVLPHVFCGSCHYCVRGRQALCQTLRITGMSWPWGGLATEAVVPGYQACVLDAQGQPVPVGTVGKLAVRGPTGCRYLADGRQTSYVRHGWNLTGDAYTMDADGYFIYQARTDDMIVSSGYNIAAPEVEDALMLHPAVAECAVIGTPDAERGQIVHAFVALRAGHAGSDVMVQALQDFVKNTIAPYKYPRAITFVSMLPRTQTGKLQRFKLRDLA